jgi:hypothetical protein
VHAHWGTWNSYAESRRHDLWGLWILSYPDNESMGRLPVVWREGPFVVVCSPGASALCSHHKQQCRLSRDVVVQGLHTPCRPWFLANLRGLSPLLPGALPHGR